MPYDPPFWASQSSDWDISATMSVNEASGSAWESAAQFNRGSEGLFFVAMVSFTQIAPAAVLRALRASIFVRPVPAIERSASAVLYIVVHFGKLLCSARVW